MIDVYCGTQGEVCCKNHISPRIWLDLPIITLLEDALITRK
jgi:hypothetical protein